MGPTPRTLWTFRATVAGSLVALVYFSRAGERYFMWATLGLLILAILSLQALGKVCLRDSTDEEPDRLIQAVNGPRGGLVRAGLLLLVVLFVLLGVGALEPSTLVDRLLGLTNAA